MERRTTPESTTITKTRKGFEVKNSSSPEQTGAAGKPRFSMLEDVKTTPQMTRFCDAKVCNNLATDEIDDHRIQSDYKCISGLQDPEGKNSTLGIASAW